MIHADSIYMTNKKQNENLVVEVDTRFLTEVSGMLYTLFDIADAASLDDTDLDTFRDSVEDFEKIIEKLNALIK